jgi:AcrR family transcriptional regulator
MSSMSPVRAAPLPPEQRRVAIIGAALPLIAEHGQAVTSKQIAAAAGVSEGTIFNVFDDKDDLLRAAFEAVVDPAPFERAVSEIDAHLPFEEQVIAAATLSQQRVAHIWKLISALGPLHHDKRGGPFAHSPALTALFERHRRRLRVEPAEAGRLLRALTLALTHPMLSDDPRSPADVADLFLHGATARRSRAKERP